MATLDRRDVLKLAGAGAALLASPGSAAAREPKAPPPDAVGLLYDATRCIGCQTCVVACREENGLAYDPAEPLYDYNRDLSAHTKNVIKLYQGPTGARSFVKMQCMHCVDPACASACMLGAFQKRENGVVTWDGSKCVGCRYCQVACPFGVPKFEWDSATPSLVKCELCPDRRAAGSEPACAEVCPVDAVQFGPREALLAEAKDRIRREPGRYEPTVYGEKEGGGTQVLYLGKAGVPFAALGLPELGEDSVSHLPESLQHTLYRGFVAPVALYGLLGALVWRNRRSQAVAGHIEPDGVPGPIPEEPRADRAGVPAGREP